MGTLEADASSCSGSSQACSEEQSYCVCFHLRIQLAPQLVAEPEKGPPVVHADAGVHVPRQQPPLDLQTQQRQHVSTLFGRLCAAPHQQAASRADANPQTARCPEQLCCSAVLELSSLVGQRMPCSAGRVVHASFNHARMPTTERRPSQAWKQHVLDRPRRRALKTVRLSPCKARRPAGPASCAAPRPPAAPGCRPSPRIQRQLMSSRAYFHLLGYTT